MAVGREIHIKILVGTYVFTGYGFRVPRQEKIGFKIGEIKFLRGLQD